MQIYIDMVRHNMVDAIVDMNFFEALGFRHYRGTPVVDDKKLRELYIDRIYDTFIDEEQLQVCDEVLGHEVDVHKYAVQITVADVRDGVCSSSTLKEAASWGKVDTAYEQMVFAEATSVLPLIASCVFHKRFWEGRPHRRWSAIYKSMLAGESR